MQKLQKFIMYIYMNCLPCKGGVFQEHCTWTNCSSQAQLLPAFPSEHISENWVIWSQLSVFYFNHVETKYLAHEAFVDRRALGQGWAVHLRLSFSFLLFLWWTYERQGNQTPITSSKPSVSSPCEGSKTQTGYVPAQCCPVGPAIEEEDKTDFWSKV